MYKRGWRRWYSEVPLVSKAGADRREEHSGLKKATGAVPGVPMAREAMDEVLSSR